MIRVEPRHGNRMSPRAVMLLLSAPVLGTGQVWAQDFGSDEDKSGLNYVLGGGAFYSSVYEGSDDYKVSALPFFIVTYGNRATVDIGGLQYDVYESGPLTLTAGIGYAFGRKEADSADLRGLGDIDGGANLSFGVDYAVGPVNLYADIERTFGGSDGLTGSFGAEISRPVGPVMVAAAATATWADDAYMQSYFGVTSSQSAASGLARYDAGAGLKSAGLELSATYFLNEHWMLRGQVGVSELLGDAADSPIVKETTQFSTQVFVAFRF